MKQNDKNVICSDSACFYFALLGLVWRHPYHCVPLKVHPRQSAATHTLVFGAPRSARERKLYDSEGRKRAQL